MAGDPRADAQQECARLLAKMMSDMEQITGRTRRVVNLLAFPPGANIPAGTYPAISRSFCTCTCFNSQRHPPNSFILETHPAAPPAPLLLDVCPKKRRKSQCGGPVHLPLCRGTAGSDRAISPSYIRLKCDPDQSPTAPSTNFLQPKLCQSCHRPLPPADALPTSTQAKELSELLRTSSAPRNLSHFHSTITSSTTALAWYDSEIRGLQATLNDLMAGRDKLQEYVAGCKSVIAPIHQLPAEILCEIFTPFSQNPFLEDVDSWKDERRNLAKSDLLVVSHVCAHWRQLILETPRLWSNIAVYLYYWPQGSESLQLLELLVTALERGGSHPLQLKLDLGLSNLPVAAQQLLIHRLVQHSHRWQNVELEVEARQLALFRDMKGRLAILKSIDLHICDADDQPVPEAAPDFDGFELAPQLTQVNLTFEADLRDWCPKFPWSQLDLMRFSKHTQDMLLLRRIMENLSDHASFYIEAWWDNIDLLPQTPMITSQIYRFEVGPPPLGVEFGPLVLGRLFGGLTLPRLRTLTFKSLTPHPNTGNEIIHWPTNAFGSLAQRSSFCSTLQLLQLSPGLVVTEDDLLCSLEMLAALRILEISDQKTIDGLHILITDMLLQRLAYLPDTPHQCPVPQLKHLICTTFFEFTGKVYFDFVVSRLRLNPASTFHVTLRRHEYATRELEPDVHRNLLDLGATESRMRFLLE